jgi:hypothetical protein
MAGTSSAIALAEEEGDLTEDVRSRIRILSRAEGRDVMYSFLLLTFRGTEIAFRNFDVVREHVEEEDLLKSIYTREPDALDDDDVGAVCSSQDDADDTKDADDARMPSFVLPRDEINSRCAVLTTREGFLVAMNSLCSREEPDRAVIPKLERVREWVMLDFELPPGVRALVDTDQAIAELLGVCVSGPDAVMDGRKTLVFAGRPAKFEVKDPEPVFFGVQFIHTTETPNNLRMMKIGLPADGDDDDGGEEKRDQFREFNRVRDVYLFEKFQFVAIVDPICYDVRILTRRAGPQIKRAR